MPRPDSTTDVLPLGSERGAAFGRSLLSGIDTDSTFRVFLQGVGGLIAKILGVMQPYDGDVGILQYFLASVEGTSAILGIDTNDFTTAGNAIINIGTSPGYEDNGLLYEVVGIRMLRDRTLVADVKLHGSLHLTAR